MSEATSGDDGRGNRGRPSFPAYRSAHAGYVPYPKKDRRDEPGDPTAIFREIYCSVSATKRSSPWALATSSSADLRPSFLSWSTRFCRSVVLPTCSWETSTMTSPALRRLSAAGGGAATPGVTHTLNACLIL